MPKSVNVMVRLSPEDAEGLDRLCERFGAKRGPTLRRLLSASVKRHDAEVAMSADAVAAQQVGINGALSSSGPRKLTVLPGTQIGEAA
jgi:predicted transcriptional regulator